MVSQPAQFAVHARVRHEIRFEATGKGRASRSATLLVWAPTGKPTAPPRAGFCCRALVVDTIESVLERWRGGRCGGQTEFHPVLGDDGEWRRKSLRRLRRHLQCVPEATLLRIGIRTGFSDSVGYIWRRRHLNTPCRPHEHVSFVPRRDCSMRRRYSTRVLHYLFSDVRQRWRAAMGADPAPSEPDASSGSIAGSGAKRNSVAVPRVYAGHVVGRFGAGSRAAFRGVYVRDIRFSPSLTVNAEPVTRSRLRNGQAGQGETSRLQRHA